MEPFKVSIIIPVYNREKFIENAVESCVHLPQTGEILIIEDGSTDGTLQIIRNIENKYSKVKILQHNDGKNHGCSASRNLGIIKAKYEYISFLDSDDRYLPNRFNNEERLFLENSDIDGIYGITNIVFDNQITKENFFKSFDNDICKIDDNIIPSDLYKTYLFSHQGQWHTNAIVLRKRAFDKAGLFPEGIKFCEDVHLWCRLAAKCTLVSNLNPEPVAIWQVHSQNTVLNINNIFDYSFKFLYRSLLEWALKQKDFSYDKKNDFFIGHKKMYPEESNFKTLTKFVIRHPIFLFNKFTWHKLIQIIKH